MSFLELSGLDGFFDNAAESFSAGWGPFSMFTAKEKRKEKKDAAKAKLYSDAQSFEQKRLLSQDEARYKAMENLRAKVVDRLGQMEQEAMTATGLIIEIRELAASPVLKGDAILEELSAVLADTEKAVIQVQAGTVVDTATFDTDALAQAYADAQAGLVAMRAITARAQSVHKTLEGRIKELADEQVRIQLAAAARADQIAAQERRDRQLADQQAAARAEAAAREGRLARRDLMSRILEVDRELSKEKRRRSALKVELANARFARSYPGALR